MGTKREYVNRLGRASLRKVEDIVLSHKDDILAGKWQPSKLAAKATKQLGFLVTPANVRSAAKVLEIDWPQRDNDHRGPISGSAVRQLRAAIAMLAGELKQLRGELGVPVSPTLESLSNITASQAALREVID